MMALREAQDAAQWVTIPGLLTTTRALAVYNVTDETNRYYMLVAIGSTCFRYVLQVPSRWGFRQAYALPSQYYDELPRGGEPRSTFLLFLWLGERPTGKHLYS